ncbi:unnamed protein product [Parnassius apollo]|uniref:(apollo) hypothetical protein n=1 Tax=Parnassius apollo TaxID=110799 RepID=A0A8S3WC49_PARAO|nr:unnamed protein product [Parnassius apollo]
MTPTRPVVTDDHFEENCVSPTSKVGSVQAQNADKWIEANDGLRAFYLRRSKITCDYLWRRYAIRRLSRTRILDCLNSTPKMQTLMPEPG